MATKYAAGTTVPVNRSKADLEKICIKYGAKNFSVLQNDFLTAIFFKYHDRVYRFDMDMGKIKIAKTGNQVNDKKKFEAEERRRWRVMVITLKAMFESVENEVMDYELLFQPYTVLPDNTIIGHRISKQIDQLYAGDTAHDLLGNNI